MVNTNLFIFLKFFDICQTILSFGEHIPYEKTEYHKRKLAMLIWLCFLVYQIVTSSLIKKRNLCLKSKFGITNLGQNGPYYAE